MEITIDGKEYTPVYNFGTLRRIGEATKQDPFTLNIDYQKPSEIYRYVHIIVLAGLQSAKVSVTAKQVQETIDEWGLAQAMQVITEFNQSFAGEKNGEESPKANPFPGETSGL